MRRGNVVNSRDEDGEVGRGDDRVADELDKVGDDDAGHAGRVSRALLEGTHEERDHDGEDRGGNFRDEGRRGERLDG